MDKETGKEEIRGEEKTGEEPLRGDGDFREAILNTFDIKQQDIRAYSPLGFAFLGDAVYSLIARTIVFSGGNRQAEKMHNASEKYVSARAQAAIGDAMQPYLDAEEARIYKRGLHSNPAHHAKNATIEEYMKATAVETLCGYLYTQGRTARFLELMKKGIDALQNKDEGQQAVSGN